MPTYMGHSTFPYIYGTTYQLKRNPRKSRLHLQATEVDVLLEAIRGHKESLLVLTLKDREFIESSIDARVLIKSHRSEFIIIIIVREDLLMVSNSRAELEAFKGNLPATFNIKLLGAISSLFRWEIQRSEEGIFISQRR